MISKTNNKGTALMMIIMFTVIALVLLGSYIVFIGRGTTSSRDTINQVFNCKHPGGWNGKCVHVSESCEKYGLDDWSKLPLYENACYDKSNSDTKELKCCMYKENPVKEIYTIVDYKVGDNFLLSNKESRDIYTGGGNKDQINVKLILSNINNEYLPKPIHDFEVTVQLPSSGLRDPCMDKEKVYHCNVAKFGEDNPKRKNCTIEAGIAGDDPSAYLEMKPGGCYLTLIAYSKNDKVVFTDEFWINVVQEEFPN